MNIHKTPLRTFIALVGAVSTDMAILSELPKPAVLGRHIVPETLNELMLGQLFALQGMTQPLFESPTILFGCSQSYVLNCSAAEVLGFNVWIVKELQRIAKLFDSIPSKPLPEEVRAGVLDLKFGLFGIVDNYARRMGITDHDYVLQCVPWITVWQCMKNDADAMMYQRRLRTIYNDVKR